MIRPFRRRIVGMSLADEPMAQTPNSVEPSRECDFCGNPPTTHWLTFTPTKRGINLPEYLGSCDACAATLDFSNQDQLERETHLDLDEAAVIAQHFDTVTRACT